MGLKEREGNLPRNINTSKFVSFMKVLLTFIFSREYWSGSPFPSPGDLPDPGIEPGPPALQMDSLLSEPPRKS